MLSVVEFALIALFVLLVVSKVIFPLLMSPKDRANRRLESSQKRLDEANARLEEARQRAEAAEKNAEAAKLEVEAQKTEQRAFETRLSGMADEEPPTDDAPRNADASVKVKK